MSEYRVRVLNGTYAVEEEGVRIDLFGRTKDGRSIALRYRGFLPYFYIVSPSTRILGEISNDPEVMGHSFTSLIVNNVSRSCLRVELKRPFMVPRYRKRYRKKYTILAADIPFVQRFYYDMNLGSVIEVAGEEVGDEKTLLEYTTDLVVDISEARLGRSFKTYLKIFSFDLENSLATGAILCICCAIRGEGEEMRFEVLRGSEDDIIESFIELVIREDPDILTGYNIDNYDIPHILRRMREARMGDSLDLGRNRAPLSDDGYSGWSCKGRVIIDAWKQVKKEKRPKRETLRYVSSKYLGVSKLDIDPRKMDQEWASDPERVIEYCKRDAELPLRLLEKLDIIQKNIDLSQVSRLPLDDVVRGRTSTLIDSILVREADRNSIGIPLTVHEGSTKSVIGGYVHEMKPGLYNWLCVLDFKSMYPSIIISNNICFTTRSEHGTIVAPNGARFLSPDVKEGLLPGILRKLMKDREKAKKMSMEGSSEAERKYYDGFQQAIKVLMNAFYGVFASNFYRFTDKSIGGAITNFARRNITKIIDELRNEGIHVVYSDTDSIFVSSPFAALDTTRAFGDDLAKRFSEEGAVLEFEKVLETFFAHGAKKRYVGKVVWPVEGQLVRGYEIRRSDSFDILTDTLKEVFSIILTPGNENAPKEVLALARNVISEVRGGNVDPSKLIISKTVKKETSYKNPERMANVQAMEKLLARNYEFTPGMKVSYIVTDGKRTPQEVEPVTDEGDIDIIPDWDYYADRIAKSLSRITEVFGYDKKQLLNSLYQRSIDQWTGTDDAPRFRASPPGGGMVRNGGKESDSTGKTKTLLYFM